MLPIVGGSLKMKRSDFIKKALDHDLNSLFVTEEQVERAIELFEDLGMLPPFTGGPESDDLVGCFALLNEWDVENEEK